MGHDAGVASPLPALLLVILGACAAPRAPEPVVPRPPANPDVQAAAASVARGLLRAQPADWAAHMEAAWSAGERIVAPLVDGLQQDPEAPGGQPAVRLLGMFGGKVAIQFLETHLRERGRNATEAALALGEADARAAVPLLRETAVDRLADPTLRCACTAGLVPRGRPGRQDARPRVRPRGHACRRAAAPRTGSPPAEPLGPRAPHAAARPARGIGQRLRLRHRLALARPGTRSRGDRRIPGRAREPSLTRVGAVRGTSSPPTACSRRAPSRCAGPRAPCKASGCALLPPAPRSRLPWSPW